MCGTYIFEGDTKPVSISLDPPIPGVKIEVTSVSLNQDGVTMNITSIFSGDTSILIGSSVQCASTIRFTSNSYTVSDVRGKESS